MARPFDDEDRPARARRVVTPPKPERDPDVWDEVEDGDSPRVKPRRRSAPPARKPAVLWVVGGLTVLTFVVVLVILAVILWWRGAENPPRILTPFEPPQTGANFPLPGPVAPPLATPADNPFVVVPPQWSVPGRPNIAVPAAPIAADVNPLPEFTWPSPPGTPGTRTRLVKADSFPASGNAVEIAVTGQFLCARNSGVTVRAFDLKTKKLVGMALAEHKFISLSASPDGNAVFAADYGGENTGYGNAVGVHRLHRFDTAKAKWDSRPAPGVVGVISAVAHDRVVMSDLDQWVEMRLTLWEPKGIGLRDLGKSGGYRAGSIAYDPASRRVFHTGFELSSCKVLAAALGAKQTVGPSQEASSLVIGHGGQRLYNGMSQFELADPTRKTNSFRDIIVAATNDLAIGANGNYYSAATADLVGRLPFAPDGSERKERSPNRGFHVVESRPAAIAVSPDGGSVWVYDPKADEFVRFEAVVP